MSLVEKKCVPCEGGVEPMSIKRSNELLTQVNNWKIEGNAINKHFSFINFKHAMDFVNNVAEVSENEGHHPDIYISYAKVSISIQTHAINGLTENDFILAAKIDKIL